MSEARALLVTLTGRDRPGVTSALFQALARHDVAVLDVEQVVIRRRLVLGVLVTCGANEAGLLDTVTRAAAELGMDVETTTGPAEEPPPPAGRSHVAVLSDPLRPAALAALAGRIADCGANIDRIVRLARYPVVGIELEVSVVEAE